ncbi:MAG: hypothetical protein RIR00_2539 [Pseudomonadota bacterium]
MSDTLDQRRFGGMTRLYGAEGAAALRAAHICVVGIGGVGCWAVEALARSGIGALTLIDLDMIAESNTNRQLHALGDEYGKAKVGAMAERVRAINPACRVQAIEDFVDADNLPRLITPEFSAVIDAIDNVRIKTLMIAHCKAASIPIVTAGAAGGQIDPGRIRCDDLARTEQDPLLAKVRSQLRKSHGFPRGGQAKFGVTAVYSTEPLRYPTQACAPAEAGAAATGPAGLNCAGFGSSICVTATFGLMAAAQVINRLAT